MRTEEEIREKMEKWKMKAADKRLLDIERAFYRKYVVALAWVLEEEPDIKRAGEE